MHKVLIDPITLNVIVRHAGGHIIPRNFGCNDCVDVDADVDNFFGDYDAALYKYVDFLDGNTAGRLLFDNFKLRCDFRVNESKIEVKVYPAGKGSYTRDKLFAHLKEQGEVNYSFEYNPLSAKISVLHSAFLFLCRECRDLMPSDWIPRIMLKDILNGAEPDAEQLNDMVVFCKPTDSTIPAPNLLWQNPCGQSILVMLLYHDQRLAMLNLPDFENNWDRKLFHQWGGKTLTLTTDHDATRPTIPA